MTGEALKLRASHNRASAGLGARLWGRVELAAQYSGVSWTVLTGVEVVCAEVHGESC